MSVDLVRIAILDDVIAQAEKRQRWIEGRFWGAALAVEAKLFEFVEDFVADVESGSYFDLLISDLFMFKKGPPRGDTHKAEHGGLAVLEWLGENKRTDASFNSVQLLWVSAQSTVNEYARKLQSYRDLDSWWDYVEDQAAEGYFLNKVEKMIRRIARVSELRDDSGLYPDTTTKEGLVLASDLILAEVNKVQQVPWSHRRIDRLRHAIPYLIYLFQGEEKTLTEFLVPDSRVNNKPSEVRWAIFEDRFHKSQSYIEKLRPKILAKIKARAGREGHPMR